MNKSEQVWGVPSVGPCGGVSPSGGEVSHYE